MDRGWRNTAVVVAPCGSLAWVYALWPLGGGAAVAGGLCGAGVGVAGAWLFARLADRAAASGSVRGGAVAWAVMLLLFAFLVLLPSWVGAAARHRPAKAPDAEPGAAPDRGRLIGFWDVQLT